MAKIAQLKKQNNDIYPRTLDECVLVSGTTLLSTKISEIDGDINGLKDGTIPIGKSISAVTDSEGNNFTSTYSTKAELSAHTSDTVIHVTQSEKNTWDAKSDFSGSYNDLTDKPTKLSDFTDDVVAGNYVRVDSVGEANGVASLGSDGKVPSSQLPSYVDDVQEFEDFAHLPASGESGIIYITLDDNLEYRWSGTQYVEISKSLALGETSSTAYAGDKGKAVTDNFNAHSGNTTIHITAQERTAWDGAVASGHTHDNKSVLDDITSADTNNWDEAYTDKHTHDNKSVIDAITSADTAAWDEAVVSAHTHTNKTVLDGITAQDITNWDNKPDTDTTYQFEQSGNTLMVGEDNGTKTAVYTPSYGTLTVGEIETGTDTESKFVSASVLKSAYNISGNTINIGGDSMTFGAISEAQIRALFQ